MINAGLLKTRSRYGSKTKRDKLFARIVGARKTDVFPAFIEPSHPTLRPTVPDGDRWLHEIKVDGCRLQIHVWHGGVAAYTRRGHNWTSRFRSIVDAASGFLSRKRSSTVS